MQITTPMILREVAKRAADVPGVARSYYPPPNTLMESPAVVVLWGGQVPSTVQHEPNMQRWLVTATLLLLVPYKSETPREIGRIDELITPLADAFTVRDGVPLPDILPAIGGALDRLLVTEVSSSQQIRFAAENCYAASLSLSIAFRRIPGGTP